MRVMITGSRTITAPWKVVLSLHRAGVVDTITELVSGGASGVDTIAEEWAKRRGIPIHQIKPRYDKYSPKVAPLRRNEELAVYTAQDAEGVCVGVWDGKSGGTFNALGHAQRYGLTVYRYTYLPDTPKP